MNKLSIVLLAALGLVAAPSIADVATAQKLADKYMAFAKNINPDAKPSADAGKAFFNREITVSGKQVSCSSCHTENPAATGRHMTTNKPIKPLAPSVNNARFSDLDKVETNFTKHCLDVLGKDCSAQEKADYITYLLTVK